MTPNQAADDVDHVVSTSYLHQSTGEVLDRVQRGSSVGVTRYGRLMVVLVPPEHYAELLRDRAELTRLQTKKTR